MRIDLTPQTATASTVHHKVGHTDQGLWHHKLDQLPAYIQNLAKHLIPKFGESRGIAMAVGVVQDWAAGHDGKGHKVSAVVQAAAARNIAEWERLRAQAHVTKRDHAQEAPMSALNLTADQRQRLDLAVTAAKRARATTYPGTSKFPIEDQADFEKAWNLRGASKVPKAKVEAWLRALAKRKGYTIPGGAS